MVLRITFSRGIIGPSLKGQYYSYTSQHGEVTASWPQKRGRKSNDLDKLNKKLFKDACIATKIMAPDFIAYHAENAKGTPMLPRDALIAALFGKGPVIHLPNGQRRIPMATRVDMSMMMDNIAWRAGSILWRNEEVWEGLDPPDEYKVLVYDPELGPYWADPSSVASGKSWIMPIGTNLTSHASPCKGNKWTLWADIVVDALQARHTVGSGVTFNWSIYRVNSTGGILEIIFDAANPAPGAGGDQMSVFTMPSPLTLLAGNQYMICIRVPGLGNTYNLGVRNGGLVSPNLGLYPDEARYWCTKQAPAVGDSFTFDSSTSLYMVGFRGQ